MQKNKDFICKNNKNRTKIQEMFILLEYIHIYSVFNNATVEIWVIEILFVLIIAH